MALDTSGAYTAGDDVRVIEALGLPFGQYVLTCVQNSLNQLEDLSSEAAQSLVDELLAYETAKSAKATQDLADTEGKTLVKADVLEWEVNKGEASGLQQEMGRALSQISRFLSFSPCLSGYLSSGTGGTQLIRS